jgi:Flp pilus assembly protein TadG
MTATRKHCPNRRSSGAAVLDMALVLPILLALAFGTVEFGYYFYVKHNVQAAAREGARAGIVPSATNQNVTDAVLASMQAAGFSSGQYTVTITDTATPPVAINVSSVAAGTPVKVTVTCNWGTVGMRPLGLIGATKNVVGATVMRKEG